MKKTIHLFLVGVLMIITSCDDYLDTDSPSKQSDETTYNTEAMTKAGIMGVYSTMMDTYVYGQKIPTNWQSNTDVENAGFNFNDYRSNTSDYGPNHYYNHSSNTTIFWRQLFLFANLANAAAEGIRNGGFMKSDPDRAKAYLGEALVLRSLAYFELLKFWGDIPYRFAGSDPTEVYIPKSSRDVVYDDLIKDMKEVIDENYLDYVGSGMATTVERVTRGFAKGLLARIALHAGGWSIRDRNSFPEADTEVHSGFPEMNGCYVGRLKNYRDYYEIALQQCAEMLGDPTNPHGLDPDYEHIWETVCRLQDNPFKENLYEIAFGLGHNGNIGNTMGPEVQSGAYGPMGYGGAYCHSTMYYFYSFSPEDTRRDATTTFVRRKSDRNEDVTCNLMTVRLAKWRFDWTDDKYKELFLTNMSRVDPGTNWIVMRYSDIYLMFAEAMNELHGPDQSNAIAGMTARAALEKVRERAFGAGSSEITNYSSDFFDAIVNERAWEFGGEAIRRHDLARWGLLVDKIEAMKEALCLMMDTGNQPHQIKIFDKTYNEFPDVLYYRLYPGPELTTNGQATALRVDGSSCNYYRKMNSSPFSGTKDKDWGEVNWFPKNYDKPEEENATSSRTYREAPAQALIVGTGLNPTSFYNYSDLLGRMTYGSEIESVLRQYPIGNDYCYYRYFYAVKESDLVESKGMVTNSYGY